MKILITGGAGYIGTHVILELRKRGYTDLHVIDRFLTSSPNWVGDLVKTAYDGDILSYGAIDVLRQDFDVIIHLAAYISVEESTKDPVMYWRNNLLSTNKILDTMKGAHLIFASTGTAFQPTNPYAQSKLACEHEITTRLDGFYDPNYTIFRFYNVSGLGPGVAPTGNPTHLIRRAAMAAHGLLPSISIMGTDWDTPDGTCVRDYIHAQDLASSIVNCIERGPSNMEFECLGSGRGYSVKEVIDAMKRVSGVDFKVKLEDRRPGDVASMICPSQYEHITLNHDLDSMCLSAYEGLKT